MIKKSLLNGRISLTLLKTVKGRPVGPFVDKLRSAPLKGVALVLSGTGIGVNEVRREYCIGVNEVRREYRIGANEVRREYRIGADEWRVSHWC
jgi:hypothetical protein